MEIAKASELLYERVRRGKRPAYATFQVTERCNYDCVHCYQDHGGAGELSTQEVFRILRELADAGVLFLLLMGGEFFMRRDADDILRRAHELGFKINLKTTGHHVHEKRADLIASLKPITVELSVYAATPSLHEQITEQPGSHARTIAAAQRLVNRGVRVIFNCPVTEQTASDVSALERLATAMGVQLTCDSTITPKTNGDDNPTALRMRWRTLMHLFSDQKTRVGRELAQSYGSSEERPREGTPCRAGQGGVGITPTGKVWPCMSLPVDCGDLRRQSFESLWKDSKPLDEIRHLTWGDLKGCSDCELRHYCNRCHAVALTEHDELEGPSLEACRRAVAIRDALREQGVIPASETALPPTWSQVNADGQHQCGKRAKHSSRLRVL